MNRKKYSGIHFLAFKQSDLSGMLFTLQWNGAGTGTGNGSNGY